MSVVARTMISVPERSASATWAQIVQLIAPDARSSARLDLAAVAGVACACITEEALADDALVVYGVGPRLRIYALYGDDAIEGDGASESPLSYVPTDGDWHMSIPCLPDDLAWVQRSLDAASSRVTARAVGEAVEGESDDDPSRSSATMDGRANSLTVDRDAFFRR
jgi:hypothetical protein